MISENYIFFLSVNFKCEFLNYKRYYIFYLHKKSIKKHQNRPLY